MKLESKEEEVKNLREDLSETHWQNEGVAAELRSSKDTIDNIQKEMSEVATQLRMSKTVRVYSDHHPFVWLCGTPRHSLQSILASTFYANCYFYLSIFQ